MIVLPSSRTNDGRTNADRANDGRTNDSAPALAHLTFRK